MCSTVTPAQRILAKVRSLVLVSAGGFGAFSALSIYNENEDFYDNIFMPLVRKLDPETSHNLAIAACKYKLFPKSRFVDPSSLQTKVLGMDFENPLGIAAGFDKQAEAAQTLRNIGFGFVEIGSVTPLPQTGQEKPRVFRLEESEALINRMGFNSDGHEVVHQRLVYLRNSEAGKNFKLGVNLGKNKTSDDALADYSKGVELFSDVADYLVVNVSSPNTAGLRDLQEEKQLKNLLSTLIRVRNSLPPEKRKPLLVKISPDLTVDQRKQIADVVTDKWCRVDGLICSNTTTARPSELKGPHVEEAGGLSGRPLKMPSNELISDMYKLTKGAIPIIGVGGVSSGLDAYNKILSGASLIQIYTTFAYHGPPRVTRIKRELDEHLKMNGWKSVAEAVGKGVSR
ncbi:dihydroorotate dehydrogenase (quinone), mitochondrial [Neocloeon triangulifer]|uniref:dihydroorotate dehydrogenase (quinone), mitochondrial n=1 Tax=Neocloeon triangulifer TaxID=2078957 RepID=UPI00286EE034|nr:dihydroorotate dehydrogenase (quinone), mitochondrial [Neocloeon triangulifer]XP_059472911.1 dihydroorotate dehydrogenase (quinone), mitochondrial [Neocloeon triangulifer]